MKQELKRTNSNKTMCLKNNNEHVGTERTGTRPIPTMPDHNKGITLVALIITIIVLLILAVVAISAVTGKGIIAHAKNAKAQYTEEQKKEQDMLEYYEATLAGKVGAWKQEGATITKINSDGTKTQLKIGDYVAYNEGSFTHTPVVAKGAGTSQTGGSISTGWTLATSELKTEDLKWRVLGVNDKGELELISADPTTQTLYLANDEGYVNAEDNLNNFCNDLYGKGQYATGARSLKVEDIDKLSKYDKTTYSGYGVKWQYKGDSTKDKIQYSKDNGSTWADTSYTTFRLPNETAAISKSNPGTKELEYTYYSYNIANNITTEDGYTSEETTNISNMIINGTTSSCIVQWLATRSVFCNSSYAVFIVHYVLGYDVGGSRLFSSDEYFDFSHYRVRPVVSLESDIQITGTGDNIGSSSNEWQLSK